MKVSTIVVINSRYRRFHWLLFAVLAKSIAAMNAVVADHVVAVPAGRQRSIDRDRRYRLFLTVRSLVHSTDTCAGLGFRYRFWAFFAHKKIARPN